MEIITVFVCMLSLNYPDLPEMCGAQDMLVDVTFEATKMELFCETLADRVDKDSSPFSIDFRPVVVECRIFDPETDEDRLSPTEFVDEHD